MPAVLTKHHVFGNDFLVIVDQEVDGDLARAWCDRHRGVGADGLIGAEPSDDGDVRMHLFNADGGRAELSGNGLACLAQALGRSVTVLTDAGPRRVELNGDRATVSMGTVKGEPDGDAMLVDVGNPHLVVRSGDLLELGRRHRDKNVELIRPASGGIAMEVHERGVGITDACGSGACAAALAARHWGLVGDRVTVHQPGGDALVVLTGDDAKLTVPVTYVARIEVPCRS